HDGREALDRLLERSQDVRQVRRGDEETGAAIAGNVLDFTDMQPRVDRNGAEAGGPAGEHQLQELGAVLHAQNDLVAGFETTLREAAREARNAVGEFTVSPGMIVVGDRRRLWLPAGDIEQ